MNKTGKGGAKKGEVRSPTGRKGKSGVEGKSMPKHEPLPELDEAQKLLKETEDLKERAKLKQYIRDAKVRLVAACLTKARLTLLGKSIKDEKTGEISYQGGLDGKEFMNAFLALERQTMPPLAAEPAETDKAIAKDNTIIEVYKEPDTGLPTQTN